MKGLYIKCKREKKKIIALIKIIASIIVAAFIMRAFYGNGFDTYYTEKVYDYQNELTGKDNTEVDLSTPVLQNFLSKGQSLTNIRIYVSELPDVETELTVELLNSNGKEIACASVSTVEMSAEWWNTIEMNIDTLKRGEVYTLKIYTDGSEGVISGVAENADEDNYLTSCYANDSEISGCLTVGIHQVCRYITLPYALWLGVDGLFLVALLTIIIYTIFNIENCVAAIREYGCKGCWLYGIVFSVSTLLMFNPMDSLNTEILEFSRVIGSGLVSGYDVTRVIGNFTSWFIAFALLMAALLMAFSFIRSRDYTEQEREAWTFLDGFMILALVNLVFRAITFFSDASSVDRAFYYSSYMIGIIIIFTMIYIMGRLGRWIDFSSCFSVLVVALSLGYPMAVIIKAGWADGRLILGMQVILLLLAVLLMILLMYKNVEHSYLRAILCACAIITSSFPLLLSLCIEIINILAGYGIYIITLRRCYALDIFAMLMVGLALTKVLIKRDKLPDEKKIAFPLLVFGVSALSVQVPLTGTYTADIFEGANASILITDFLNFGDVPLVSHYGGHMMTGVWEGILYGLINNDFAGAAFSPYRYYIVPVIALLFYFLIKMICGEKEALMTALLFPFYSTVSYYGLGIFVILAVIAFIKKNSYGRALLVWFACIWCALYRLDMGYAFIIACLATLVCYIVVNKNRKAIKPLLTTLATCGIVGLVAWTLLCIRADVNPISRLVEFLKISASNQNWAYNNIGNNTYTRYFWCYILMPLLVEGSLLYVVISKKFREKSGVIWYVLIMLGVSYFANFSRGLVRHSLAESDFEVILWTSSVYLALFAAVQIGRKSFLPVFTVLMLMTQLFESDTNFSTVSLADAAATTITSNLETLDTCQADCIEQEDSGNECKSYWELAKDDGEMVCRVMIDETLIEHLEALEYLVDALLEEDETYVDFINHTFSYSYLQKEDPVYVSQSPLQLSGEYTQEQFVAEISYDMDSNPIVIMPYDNTNCKNSVSLDGIANAVRYYKLAEYIYQNYVPLCYYGEYAVWCLSDRYEEMLDKLDTVEVEYIDALKDEVESFDVSNLDVEVKEDGIVFSYTGKDPIWKNVDDYLDITEYAGTSVRIVIEYESDTDGTMQLFYMEDFDEGFSESKSVSVTLSSEGGLAEFVVPVTKYTRLRLDIPEWSEVKLTSVKVCSPVGLINYGYDCSEIFEDEEYHINGACSLHIYVLNQLARIWGELDLEEAADNEVAATVVRDGNRYSIQDIDQTDKTNGNYLLIDATYYGEDEAGFTKENDESVTATVRLGVMEDGVFVEKYRYTIAVAEGAHQYLIRVSCDYFWYADEIDTVVLDCDDNLVNIGMKVLCGD